MLKMKIVQLMLSTLLFSYPAAYASEEAKIVGVVKEFCAAIEEGNLSDIKDLTAKSVNLSEQQIHNYAYSLVEYRRQGWIGFWIFPKTVKVEKDCGVIYTSEGKHRLEDAFYFLKQDGDWKLMCMLDHSTNWKKLTFYELTDAQKLRFEKLEKYAKELRQRNSTEGETPEHE